MGRGPPAPAVGVGVGVGAAAATAPSTSSSYRTIEPYHIRRQPSRRRKSRSKEEVCVPRIRQINLLAGTGGRRALALLHGHQVADIGQHSLEVRHFPR